MKNDKETQYILLSIAAIKVKIDLFDNRNEDDILRADQIVEKHCKHILWGQNDTLDSTNIKNDN